MTSRTTRAAAPNPTRSARAPKRAAPARPNGAIRILVADDHEVVREGLVTILTLEPDLQVVAEAADGNRAVELWRRRRPDVGLIDLRMPHLDGVGTLREIRLHDPTARIIVLTAFDDDEDIYRALRAGAKAYVLKEAGREKLLACIRKVHAGETYISSHIAAKLAERLSAIELTRRELEVLALLARGRSNKEIGRDLCISETTVKSHVKRLFVKLRVTSRGEAIATAVRRGLIHL
jgi:DNA-binding NarL/FixJ family response regulator